MFVQVQALARKRTHLCPAGWVALGLVLPRVAGKRCVDPPNLVEHHRTSLNLLLVLCNVGEHGTNHRTAVPEQKCAQAGMMIQERGRCALYRVPNQEDQTRCRHVKSDPKRCCRIKGVIRCGLARNAHTALGRRACPSCAPILQRAVV